MRQCRPSNRTIVVFAHEFGFTPGRRGTGALADAQHTATLEAIADHLSDYWWQITKCQQALQQRNPPHWLRLRDARRLPKRERLRERLSQLETAYARAESLARQLGVHPEQQAA
ncbi:MAG TPA: hypothetical protein VJ553_04530 [Candidatus Paceibacterota bacterium]|nr:hypothetical protein [Candidatus Paceibacterota bacterium]